MGDYLGTRVMTQVGIIVRDIEKTSRAFAAFFGLPLPPVVVTDEEKKARTMYRGSGTPARAKLAFFHLDNLDLELIEPDGNPSTWQEFLDTHGEGVHHLAFVIEDMKGRRMALQAAGFDTLQTGEYTGGRYAYMDTTADLKLILELLENDRK